MAQRWEFYLDASKTWRWRWTADDGTTVQQSEGWQAGGYSAAASRNRRLIQGVIDPEKRAIVTPPADLARFCGTDFGNSPVPPLSWFQTMRTRYEGAWVPSGSWSPSSGAFWHRCIDVLNLYEQAGFKYLATYHRPNRQVLAAWNALGAWQKKLSLFAFDVEDPADKLEPTAVDEVAAAMRASGVDPDKRLWLYSSYYMWQSVQGDNDGRFAARFKNIAPYDGIKVGWPDPIPPIKLFGGFAQSQVNGLQLRGAEPSNYLYQDGIAYHENEFERNLLLEV